MIEIKFRFWDKQENYWCLDGKSETNIYDFAFKPGMNWTYINKTEAIERIAVMQYTGRNDRNDKPIYEGDIIKHGESIREIIRLDCRWIAKRTNSNEAILLCFSENPLIIGNIYENPELLK